jgi:hypothetical protein
MKNLAAYFVLTLVLVLFSISCSGTDDFGDLSGDYKLSEPGLEGELLLTKKKGQEYYVEISTVNTERLHTCGIEGIGWLKDDTFTLIPDGEKDFKFFFSVRGRTLVIPESDEVMKVRNTYCGLAGFFAGEYRKVK